MKIENWKLKIKFLEQREQSQACLNPAESRQKSAKLILEQREQSQACLNPAESRQKSAKLKLIIVAKVRKNMKKRKMKEFKAPAQPTPAENEHGWGEKRKE
ncbi:MAG: hypothetical protein IKH88_01130 [Prevotella sp.]|nr:hypothetical protein [Prevotella sp.]